MKTTVLYSTQDPAGTGIAKELEKRESQHPIVKTDSGLLYCEKDLERISADFIIFASKHKSGKGEPAFTVHMPGNWSAAEMGGQQGKLSMSNPFWMKAIAVSVDKLRKKAGIDIMTCMEVDHHGPLVNTPCCFTEIGSTEAEWNNQSYAALVAEAIDNAAEEKKNLNVGEIAFGIGGGHYCPAFNKLELGEGIAMSHVMPSYAVDAATFEAFEQGIRRSTEEADVVLIDWKGLKAPQREKMIKFAGDAGADWRKV